MSIICPGCSHKNKSGAEFCKNCGHPLQTIFPSSSQNVSQKEIVQNDKKVNLTDSETPHFYTCTNCDNEIELDENDLKNGKFTCPVCNRSISVDKTKLKSAPEQKEKKMGVLRYLYICNYCNQEIEINDEEYNKGSFICPSCEVEVFIDPEKIKIISQPEEIGSKKTKFIYNCYLCDEEIELEESELNNDTITCPNCNKELSIEKLMMSEEEPQKDKKTKTFLYSFTCEYCDEEIELNKEDIVKGSFICPACDLEVIIDNSKLILNSTVEREVDKSPFFYTCKYCSKDNELSEGEISNGYYICPGCFELVNIEQPDLWKES